MKKTITLKWRNIPKEEQKFDLFHRSNQLVVVESTHPKHETGKVFYLNNLEVVSQEGYDVVVLS